MRVFLGLFVLSTLGLAAACGDDTGASGSSGSGGAGSGGDQASSTTSGVTATPALSFFVTSRGNGTGDFGGTAGTDAFCQGLAEAVGSTRTWRAYVSTAAQDARDRIGAGPWTNADDVVVATGVDALHATGIAAANIVDEFGDAVPNVSPTNEHDVLTGSNPDGTYSGDDCLGWTSDLIDYVASVGHADAVDPVAAEDNWNSAHLTTGCDAEQLVGTGGTGRLYCFAID
jgi:hypothetical protein